jgi:hypothetical protein
MASGMTEVGRSEPRQLNLKKLNLWQASWKHFIFEALPVVGPSGAQRPCADANGAVTAQTARSALESRLYIAEPWSKRKWMRWTQHSEFVRGECPVRGWSGQEDLVPRSCANGGRFEPRQKNFDAG